MYNKYEKKFFLVNSKALEIIKIIYSYFEIEYLNIGIIYNYI